MTLRDPYDLLQVQCVVGLTLYGARAVVCISLGQETGLKIVQEASSERGRPPSRGNRFEQTASLGLHQFFIEVLKMKSGALVIAIAGKSFV